VNICVVTQQYKNIFSGVGLHANNLTNALLNDGHKVTLVLPEDQAPQLISPQLSITTDKKPRFNQNQARWISLSFSFNTALQRLESQSRFDLVHFTDARESFFCTPHASMIGHVNDTYSAELKTPLEYKRNYPDWLLRWLYYSAVHYLESRKLHRLKLLVANSQYTANTIIKTYPKTAPKVRLCYKSVDIERYHEIDNRRKVSPPDLDHPIILFVGSNMYRKGVPDLIKAAPGVIKQHPQARFIIIGEDKSADRLKRLCYDLNVDRNFEFAGWQSQESLLSYYQRASVFVMPSLTEAFGVTFLEAMAAGVPVIGTNVGGIPEIIHDGTNGLLVPVESPSSITDAINQLLSDAQLRERFIQSAFSTLNNFSVDKMMECTRSLYQEILEN